MEDKAWMFHHPLADFFTMMGADMIAHEMNRLHRVANLRRHLFQQGGEKPLGPLADDGPLPTHGLSHVGLGVSSDQQQNDFPPACQPCRKGGRSLSPFQGLVLFQG
jgi:hypothetical protein